MPPFGGRIKGSGLPAWQARREHGTLTLLCVMITPSPSVPVPRTLDLRLAIAQAVSRRDFTAAQMAEIVGHVMDGEASPVQVAALLIALRMKGETVEEVVGAAQAMRQRATPLRVPDGVVVDTCGTGGDGAGTMNISTLSALVVAACGVRVAKHGNRAQSSRSGSADLVEALGVNLSASVAQVERCLREVGLGFLFAPAFHGATRHAAAVRRELGVRTLFNLLGPLTNPARVRHQVVGVYSLELLEPVCLALGQLGVQHAMVVHGLCPQADGDVIGLDEVAPEGVTHVAEWREGRLVRRTLSPSSFGLPESIPAPGAGGRDLSGGEPADNAARARALLAGSPDEEHGAAWRSIVMTAACALYVAGAADLPEGAARSIAALRDGTTQGVLEALVRVSHDCEALSAAVIDREARSAAVIDREARSAAVIDREARSAAVIDREAPR